jgi:hypothetical protein
MASSSSSLKAPCATCANKAAGIYRCEGCLNVFCRKHLNDHRDLLSHQLDEIVLEHDTLHQTIVETKVKQNNQHPLLKEIDQWEKNSIMKIQQLAEEARQQVKNSISSQTGNLEENVLHFFYQ